MILCIVLSRCTAVPIKVDIHGLYNFSHFNAFHNCSMLPAEQHKKVSFNKIRAYIMIVCLFLLIQVHVYMHAHRKNVLRVQLNKRGFHNNEYV